MHKRLIELIDCNVNKSVWNAKKCKNAKKSNLLKNAQIHLTEPEFSNIEVQKTLLVKGGGKS